MSDDLSIHRPTSEDELVQGYAGGRHISRPQEDELVQGYAGGRHISRPQVAHCACGVDIVCIEDYIEDGVAAHNFLPEHLAWRAAGGMEAHLEREANLPLPPGLPGRELGPS